MKRNIELYQSNNYVDYNDAVSFMEQRVGDIFLGNKRELIWLLEHPPLYTAGTSAKEKDLIIKDKFKVYKTGRCGQFTYHGPGQRVIYMMLDLAHHKKDVRDFVKIIEKWIISSLTDIGLKAFSADERIGVWVKNPIKSHDNKSEEKKIAAIGLRIRKWVSFHGVSINIEPDLSHYNAIIPCGIEEYGVCSLRELGYKMEMAEFDEILLDNFCTSFGAVLTKIDAI